MLLVFPYFLSMTGLVQEYVFKENLRNCEPIDFSRFAVDLRERDTSWSFGPPILMAAHESTTQQNYHFSPTTYNRWCALPPNKALTTHSPYSLPKWITCTLTFHEMSFTVLPFLDCVSTPFALTPQHRTLGPPLPVICARLKIMFRTNSMLFPLHTSPYSVSSQEI